MLLFSLEYVEESRLPSLKDPINISPLALSLSSCSSHELCVCSVISELKRGEVSKQAETGHELMEYYSAQSSHDEAAAGCNASLSVIFMLIMIAVDGGRTRQTFLLLNELNAVPIANLFKKQHRPPSELLNKER